MKGYAPEEGGVVWGGVGVGGVLWLEKGLFDYVGFSRASSPNYRDPLCAFGPTTYNTGIDGVRGPIGAPRTEAN